MSTDISPMPYEEWSNDTGTYLATYNTASFDRGAEPTFIEL